MKPLLDYYRNPPAAVAKLTMLISMVILLLIVMLPILYLMQSVSLPQTKAYTLYLTIGWFLLAPLWMQSKQT